MDKVKSLSAAEWTVMSALWDDEPLMISEIAGKIGKETNWSYSTVATYISRLCDKGILTYKERGKRRLYYPAVSIDDCVQAESNSISERMAKVGTKKLLIHMIKDAGLTDQDKDELLELIDELKSR
ncbi:BlaI/MecI/CopY family transcriptional regulator [Christensenella intestinihominis]|uniref:BlaI/MecI/CopY family transcriptional regulator n=1 Tax=Christensenella intestinihominis TaxID=1851429 RepID=UPI0008374EFC|nr:BlaI/MecI/CopY family transcriptional regulator [Christensenella intestinihominis]